MQAIVSNPTTSRTQANQPGWFQPNVDILETKDEVQLVLDIPGSAPDQFEITVENGTLTVHAKVPPRQTEGRVLLREYAIGDYHRRFQLSDSVDAEKISAEYRDGVLTLHLPRAEATKPRRVEVNANRV